MAILEPDDRELVGKYFAQKLTEPVRVVLLTASRDDEDVTAYQTGASSRQTQELLDEITSLTDMISLEVNDIGSVGEEEESRLDSEWGILGTPTIALGPAGADPGRGNGKAPPSVRFVGYPGGHEFTSFLETLASVGAKNWGLTEETVALLSEVDRTIDIKTFVTPT